jgi:hypothetical protein
VRNVPKGSSGFVAYINIPKKIPVLMTLEFARPEKRPEIAGFSISNIRVAVETLTM